MKRVLLLLIILSPLTSFAQGQSAWTGSGYALSIARPFISVFPPVSDAMPPDVRLGYRYLDSLRRTMTPGQIDQLLRRMGNNDTLKWANKFLYELDDYDPVLFCEYLRTSPPEHTYKFSGSWLMARLTETTNKVAHDGGRALMLIHSDIIAHVVVTGLESRFDSAARASLPNQVVVSCRVLDTIKGKTLPACPNCFRFCYSPQESLTGGRGLNVDGAKMQDSAGNPWVKIGGEYIAYISLTSVSGDSSQFYYTAFPAKWSTKQGGLYVVKNGRVHDPNNDMGFGKDAIVSEYFAELRGAIHRLINP